MTDAPVILPAHPPGVRRVFERLFAERGIALHCASMANRSLPKSGVYAVRQGPPLAENLRRALTGMPLIRYSPQRWALALISTGDSHAVASWDGMALSGRWMWRWKDRIDRGFVVRYQTPSAA